MTDNDRFAMLVGVSTYDSDAYHDLPPVRADLHYMRAVLQNTEIGMYNDCAMVAEPTRAQMLHAVETFLGARQPSETALLYFSGHGEFCEDDNQLYFLTRDTDPDDLPGTAVPAEFLERMLQSCRAASKLVLLDCCSSGSVVQGWTAKGPAQESARPAPSTLLRPTGVYFITASDALQSASAMAPDGSSLGTSRFTGEIVEGLRNGRIKEGGWITPDDLFEYLTAQMRRDGVPEEQRPTKSTIRATNQLPFARSVARPVHLPALPRDAAEAAQRSPALLKARQLAALDARDGVDWERLLRYYAHCLTAQSAAGMRPDRDSGRGSKYFLLGQGEETIQSGRGAAFPAPGTLPRPQGVSAGSGGSGGSGGGDAGAQQEYWYGYPAITLPVRDAGARGRRTAVELAPLLIQQMELAPDEEGRDVLRPSGVPSLHTGVVSELLDAGDAADLVARWQPSWQEGNDAQMLRAVRELLDELGLPELEPLDPSALSERTVMQALRPGAHNAAVLLVPSGVEAKATEALVDNLLQMSTRTGQIPGTALDALLSGGEVGEGGARGASVTVVAPGPCNESQESVISSAMTRPLTVATGPPGTGKSEVVTAVVTTCVAAGQSVLVASTNNEAVNVVAERCDDIAPGLLMRTGNTEALVREAAKLERLLGEPAQAPRRGSATVGGQLRSARKTADGLRAQAARHVGEEGRLLELLRDRAERAEALELPLPLLEGVWAAPDEDGPAALGRWEDRARKVAGAPWWLLGPWRRRRTLAALVSAGAEGTEEARPDPSGLPGQPGQPSWPDGPGRPSKPDGPDRPSGPNQPDRPDQPSKPNQPDRPSGPNQPDRPDRPSWPNQPDQPDQPSKPNQPSGPNQPDQPSWPDGPDQPSGQDRPGRPSWPDRSGRPSWPDRSGRPSWPDRSGRPSWPEWAGRPSWPEWADGRTVPVGLLESLADTVALEREVRALVPRHTGWDEDGLRRARLEAAGALSELSAEMSRAVSAETLTRARGLMQQRLQALRGRSGFQRSQKNLMAHIKGWAVSTHSVRQLELAPKLFDLVVIDEASQCSIPSVLPLLFRARRALIIGDPMQLGHIPGVSPQQEQQARVRAGLSAAQLEDHRLTYHVYSSYHAAEQHGDSALLLDEHYRCHPRIADVVNGYCYAGQLQVLTDVRRQVPALDPVGAADPAPALGWVDVPRGESARGGDGRSWRNAAEVAAVRRVVDELLARLPQDATVGVVTPFRAQKDALARVWRDDDRVRVGTVHAFQGGQRDVMVLSPVATHNTPPRTTHWVASQVNLWNVAVTRAKSQLITVGGHAFWQGQSGLPTLLAERSVPLGAEADEDGGPMPTAAPATGFREELADRLQQYLAERGITDLERAAVVGGHPVDLLFTEAGENTAVLIDPGPPPGVDPARHLRLTHARGDLLTGLPSGGYGAKACPVGRTVRVPAWRILAGEEVLAPLWD